VFSGVILVNNGYYYYLEGWFYPVLSGPKLRMTRQRQVILEELRKMDCHPTADEVYEVVRRRLPRISLGTVYRNLESLSSAGIIKKLGLGGTKKRFDGKLESHHHVRCIECGRLDNISSTSIPDIEGAFRGACDYQITGYQLILTGLCPNCRAKKSQQK
jgi:Fur family ferric uptake transcriptional regulator